MGRRNKGRGSTKKKRGGKSKQRSTQTKNNDGSPDTTTSTPAPSSVKLSEEVSEEEKRLAELRFKVGDRVECRMDDDTCQLGTVVVRNYQDGERIYPYGVCLDIGCVTYAPLDDDTCIKKSDIQSIPLRFVVGERVDCRINNEVWASGTIIMRNCIRDDGVGISPYCIRLDRNEIIYAPVDNDNCVKKSLDTRNFKDFKLGSRVELLLKDGEWKSGTILRCNLNWVDIDPVASSPYSILMDVSNRALNFWGPYDSIREIQASSSTSNVNDVKTLRFEVGDRVECYVGVWMPGTIIKTHYNEDRFDTEYTAPYQINLDIGNLIYAPADEDRIIRRIDTPIPPCWICFDDNQTEDNPIVRECACRGEENGYVHTQCLAKLAITKVTDNENFEEGIDDDNPFTQCITCKQKFNEGSHSYSAIAKMCMDAYGGKKNLGCPYFGIASSMYGHTITDQEDFLKKRCKMITDLQSRTSQLDLDLSRFLGDLAVVFEVKGELDRMKEALDESLSLIVALERGTHSRRKINSLSSLATHAYLVGNNNDALNRFEECIALTRPQAKENDMLLASLLLKSGNLELELGNTEKGVEQISESVDIMTVVYGRDHVVVGKMAGCLDKIRGGSLEVIPKKLMRLDFYALPDF